MAWPPFSRPLPSRSEGLPNVLLEALALEVPIVATRVAGIPRLIHDVENGLLVDQSWQGPPSMCAEFKHR